MLTKVDIHHELRRVNNVNQLILDSVAEGIYGIDLNANVIFWNQSAEKLTGFNLEDFKTNNFHDLIHHTNINGEVVPLTSCPVYLALNSGCDLSVKEDIFWTKDGTSFPVEYTVNPMLENGKHIGTVLTFRDMTEKVRTDKLLLQWEKLSLVGKMAAGIAHEIRNPLTSLKGFLKLVTSDASINKEYINIMNSEFDRIESIIKDLLVFSKPHQEHYADHNIIEILDQVIFLMNPQAALNNVDIITEFKISNITVNCIPHQIKQVIMNIIKNGIEAIEEAGQIYIHTTIQKNHVIIKIKDTGTGMSEDELNQLGNPFYTTKENGTGLGMMTTKNIIKNNHNGKISIESKKNIGTTFTIQLPIKGMSLNT
jgi:two-component system sporulation sensor kinase A